MKLSYILMMALFWATPAPAAEPSPTVIDADNFTQDPSFIEFIAGNLVLTRTVMKELPSLATQRIPEKERASIRSLPRCVDVLSQLAQTDFVGPVLLAKLRSLTPSEREQFAGLARFLHTADGKKVLGLYRSIEALTDLPNSGYDLPKLTEAFKATTGEMWEIIESQPKPNELSQALFGLLNTNLEGVGDSIEEARKAAFSKAVSSPVCVAMVQEAKAFAKADSHGEPSLRAE